MPNTKVMTAPLAIIKSGGKVIGKMKNIRCEETIRREIVKGIGTITGDEAPVLDWDGTLSCGFFMIDLSVAPFPNSINRNMQSVEDWENTLILNEDGIQVDIMRKTKGTTNGNNVITPVYQIFASILGAFATREGWDVTERQISGRDQSFIYLTPILFPL